MALNRVGVNINYKEDGENITVVLAPEGMPEDTARETVAAILRSHLKDEDQWESVWNDARPELEAAGFDFIQDWETVEV